MGGQIAQTIHCRANECSTAVSIVDKLSLQRYRCTVGLRALRKSGKLTFNGVRGRLLLAGKLEVHKSQILKL